jgi:iron complex outermembrane receptor protein
MQHKHHIARRRGFSSGLPWKKDKASSKCKLTALLESLGNVLYSNQSGSRHSVKNRADIKYCGESTWIKHWYFPRILLQSIPRVDFGTNTSYTLKGLYEVMDGLTVRASYGTGFRAPGLGDLAANTTFSAEYHYDYIKCEAQGISRADCPEEQVNTYISANPNLGPEESESTNFGVIYEKGDHSVAVDWFNTELDGIITSITVQDIIDATILGKVATLNNQGAYCERLNGQADANLQECFTNPINGNQADVSGTDIKYSGLFTTGVGDFDVNANVVIMDESNSEAFYNGPMVNFVGLTSLPEMRYTVDVGHELQAVPNLYMTLQYEYIDEIADSYDANYVAIGSVDEWTQVNLRAVYTVPGMENLTLSVAARNLTKEDPPLDSSSEYNRFLHPNLGMSLIFGFSIDL